VQVLGVVSQRVHQPLVHNSDELKQHLLHVGRGMYQSVINNYWRVACTSSGMRADNGGAALIEKLFIYLLW